MKFDSDYEMTIDGHGVVSEQLIDVINPATGKVFAKAPDCTDQQLEDAIASSRAAFQTWRNVPIDERAEYLEKIANVLVENMAELGALFTQEQGRPLDAATAEMPFAAEWLRAVAKLRPPVRIVEDSETAFAETRYLPLGVISMIIPWNFPVNLAMVKLGPAVLSGNTVVLKPAPTTPLCTLKIGELLRDILPKGVLNIVSGGDDLGPKMTAHPGFDKISFTGSTETGKKVMETAATDLKRITLELGGNDAAIIMPDVDLDDVAVKIFMGAFYNSSQICIATKRLYVHESIYEDLRDRLVAIARMTKVGDGSEPDSQLGPIQNKKQFDRVMELLESAKVEGLTLHHGGEVPQGAGYFVPLTIIDNPPEDSRVVKEEAFGPLLPMMKFTTVEEVLNRVNDSEYGLAGAVWSSDHDKAIEIARQMETGTIWINQNLLLRPDAPFAGHKQSGFGTENGEDGLLEFCAPQTILLNRAG